MRIVVSKVFRLIDDVRVLLALWRVFFLSQPSYVAAARKPTDCTVNRCTNCVCPLDGQLAAHTNGTPVHSERLKGRMNTQISV